MKKFKINFTLWLALMGVIVISAKPILKKANAEYAKSKETLRQKGTQTSCKKQDKKTAPKHRNFRYLEA